MAVILCRADTRYDFADDLKVQPDEVEHEELLQFTPVQLPLQVTFRMLTPACLATAFRQALNFTIFACLHPCDASGACHCDLQHSQVGCFPVDMCLLVSQIWWLLLV